MVHSSVRMLIPPEKEKEALEILGPMAELVRLEPGCVSCRLYRSVEDPPSIMFEQLWSSKEDALKYLRSEIYDKVLKLAATTGEPPEVRFDVIAGTTGLETIEKARLGGC
jgi:quinol monooxygenase YgiN